MKWTLFWFFLKFVFLVVFMGSEKYPDENAFDAFIKKHGGSDNASTDCEMVCPAKTVCNNTIIVISLIDIYNSDL